MNEEKILYNVIKGRQIRKINILNPDVDLTLTDNIGDSLLHIVFKKEEPDQTRVIQILEILLNHGLDINIKNKAEKTVLHLAIECRHRDIIDFCIRQNADLNLTDCNGNSLGHFLVEVECQKYHHYLLTRKKNEADNSVDFEKESTSFVNWLLSREIDFFHKRNNKNQSALYLAVECNLQPIFLTLLKHVSDLPPLEKDQTSLLCSFLKLKAISRNVANFPGNDRMYIASRYYRDRYAFNIVNMILEKNRSMSVETLNEALRMSINTIETFQVMDLVLQHTPRISDESLLKIFTKKYQVWVRIRGKENVMKILKGLVDKGANINEPYENEETCALKLFRCHPKLEMLQLLHNCGADFSVRTKDNNRFLHIIGRYSNEYGMVEIVKEACDVNAINLESQTPLKLAITHSNIFVAMDLLDCFADVNDTRTGGPPLSLACQMGEAEIVQKLIKCGADLVYKDSSKRSLMHLAFNCQRTVGILLKNGADSNAKDYKGKTPLHLANSHSIIKTLVNGGAFVDPLDREHHTPLYYSMVGSNLILFKELLKCGADIREPKTFHKAVDFFQNPNAILYKTSRYVMEHLVKMSTVDLLNRIIHTDENSKLKLQVVFNECQTEVKLLKSHFVDNYTSLYQLLHKNQNRRCAYVDKRKLKALVDDPAIVSKFPNYFVLIIGCYNEAKTRKPLLRQATSILNKIIEISLPDLCIDQIFLYLNNMDLMGFIEATKDL